MAYADTRFGYQHAPTDSALDNKQPAFIDNDNSALLNHPVLDADMMQSPDDTTFRKGSFANSNGVLSPADSQSHWDQPYSNGLSADTVSAGASNHFHDDGNVFLRQANPHVPSYPNHHPQSAWTFENGSGHSTPTTGGDFMPPPQYDGPSFVHQRADSAHGNFRPQNGLPQHFAAAPQVQTPMSPHSHQDWMGMAEREMESRPSYKRARPNSPSRSMSDFQRRDGIRKKNGRIEIPQERNIHNIEDLIENETNEEVLKELKQQKRLLRNREAALNSRQRKKKHTEDLEIKEKSFTQKIASQELQINELNRDRERRSREQQAMHQQLQEALRTIEAMENNRQNLVREHVEETSKLRRERDSLREQLEAGPAPAMFAQSSNGYAELNPGMEALHMSVAGQEWQQQEDWAVHDFFPGSADIFPNQPESVASSPVQEKKPPTSPVALGAPKENIPARNDRPVAQGVLAFLLLCGAWVATRSAGSKPADMPNMPANVRAAAPAILDNLLLEVDSPSSSGHSHVAMSSGQQPLPSAAAYNNFRPSKMDRLARSVMTPTKQQEMDQTFSLTNAQWASMTNPGYPNYGQQSASAQSQPSPPRRRVLAEALANMEGDQSHMSKSEVYTRSLLWGQIDADVIRQFKDIVRDHNEIESRQHHD